MLIFPTWVEYVGHMFYPSKLKVQKPKVETISQMAQQMNVSWLSAHMKVS
jgi:hypothetical protein